MYRWGGELGVLLTWMWWNTSLLFRGPACPSVPSSLLFSWLVNMIYLYYLFYLFGVYSLLAFVWLWCGPYVVCVCVSMCVCIIHQHKEGEEREKQMRGGSIQHVMKSAGCALPASQLKMNLDLWIWTFSSSSSLSESCPDSDRREKKKWFKEKCNNKTKKIWTSR